MAIPPISRAPSPSDPVALAHAWHAAGGGLAWLDSSTSEDGSISVVAGCPAEVLKGDIHRDSSRLRAVLQRGVAQGLGGGLFGWVGFDGRFTFGYHESCTVWRHGSGSAAWRAPKAPAGPRLQFVPQVDKDHFCRLVRRAQEYIAAGDIYQVNLSYPWLAEWPPGLAPRDFYLRLRAASPAPYGAFPDLGGTQVFSASPECFLEMQGRRIVTRPIKGTRPRGPTEDLDHALARELATSAKERAELVMITDLERNDLGQVCEYGSVRVTDLLKLERYAQLSVIRIVGVVGRQHAPRGKPGHHCLLDI